MAAPAKQELENKRIAFFERLAEASQGDAPRCTLVAEPRLDGASQWTGEISENTPYDIAVYTADADTEEWLKSSNFRRSQRIPLQQDKPAKFTLNKDTLGITGNTAWPDAIQPLVQKDQPFGENRPFILTKPIPTPNTLAIAPLETESEAQQSVLLVKVPVTKISETLDALRGNGLLHSKKMNVADYNLNVTAGDGAALISLEVPRDIADSLLAGVVSIENWMDKPAADLSAWQQEATTALQLPEQERQQAESFRRPRTPQAPAPEQPLPPLASRVKEIRTIGLQKASRILPNGDTQHGLAIPRNTNIRTLITGVSDPIKLPTNGEKIGNSTPALYFHPLSAAEMGRLEAISGPLSEVLSLGLNDKPLRNAFDQKNLDKNEVKRVLLAEEQQTDGSSRYYIYIAANKWGYLSTIADNLGLDMLHRSYLSEDKERPGLIRLQVPQATWNRTREIFDAKKGNRGAISSMYEVLEASTSLQWLDEDARQKSGLSKQDKTQETTKATTEAPKHEGPAAEAFFLKKLAGIDNAQMVLSHVKRGRPGEEITVPVLYVRAAGNALGEFKNILSKDTSMFREGSEMRKLSGAEQGSAGAAIWEFDLTSSLLAALQQREGMEILNDAENAPQGKQRKAPVEQYFRSKDEQKKARDETQEAITLLRTIPLLSLQIDKSDAQKLAAIQTELDALQPILRTLAAPLVALEEQDAAILKALEKFKQGKAPAEIKVEFSRMRVTLAKTHRQLSEEFVQQVQRKLDGLQSQYTAIEARGIHTQYLGELTPEYAAILRRLVPEYIEEMEPSGDRGQFTRLLLTKEGAQTIVNRTGTLASINKPLPFDALKQFSSQQFFDAFAEMRRAHESDIAGYIPPAPATANEPTEEEPGRLITKITHVPKTPRALTVPEALRDVRGFLALEKQEPTDEHTAVEDSIDPQHVLVLSAATREDIAQVQSLKDALQREGLLLPSPQFYGEITRGTPRPKRQDVTTETEAKRESLEEQREHIEGIKSYIDEIQYRTRQWSLPHEERQDKTPTDAMLRQLNGLKEQIAPLAQDLDYVRASREHTLPTVATIDTWIAQASANADTAPEGLLSDIDSTLNNFKAHLNSKDDSLVEALSELPTEKKPSKSSSGASSEYVIRVISGESEYYPVEGKLGDYKTDAELYGWTPRPNKDGDTPPKALKLYLTPEGAEHLAALSGRARSENIRNRIQPDNPLSSIIIDSFASEIDNRGPAR